jgi:hypothetical protein
MLQRLRSASLKLLLIMTIAWAGLFYSMPAIAESMVLAKEPASVILPKQLQTKPIEKIAPVVLNTPTERVPPSTNFIGPSLPAPKADSGPLPINLPAQPAAVTTAESTKETATDATSGEEGEAAIPLWKGTIMFSQKEYRDLLSALQAAESGTPMPDEFSKSLDSSVSQDALQRIAPVFYINSIIYLGPKNWSIVLNGKNIRSYASTEGARILKFAEQVDASRTLNIELEILNVTMDEVLFSWSSPFLPIMAPNPKRTLPVVMEGGFTNENRSIYINETRDTLRVRLGVNQTFSTLDLSIEEGRHVRKKETSKDSGAGAHKMTPSSFNKSGPKAK